MRKVIGLLFVLCGVSLGAMSPCALTWPDINNETQPKVVHVDVNLVDLLDCDNEDRDTLNNILSAMGGTTGATGLSSTGDIKANIDRDSNSTGSRFWVANHTNDTLFRVSDDLAIRAYGAFSVVGSSTLAALSATTGAFLSTLSVAGNQTNAGTFEAAGNVYSSGTGTGFWINSPGTFTYGMYQTGTSLAFRSGSGTPWLTVTSAGLPTFANATAFTSLLTASAGVFAPGPITIGQAGVANGIVNSTVSTYFNIDSDNNATGESFFWGHNSALTSSTKLMSLGDDGNLTVNSLAGTGTRLTTSTSTGVQGNATAIAGANTWIDKQTHTTAPRFNSATASEFLLLDGSKDLTSVAGNGTGNVVRTTSPALVTPSLGAATATTIALGGNEAFDYDEGFFTAAATGMSACTNGALVGSTCTGTAYYTRVGKMVHVYVPPLLGTSSNTGLTITGLPPALNPARANETVIPSVVNNNNNYNGFAILSSSGVFTFSFRTTFVDYPGSVFTAANLKGHDMFSFTYTLQ